MRRLLTMPKRCALWIAAYGSLPLVIALTLAGVVAAYRALRSADVVVVMYEGGFGHTVTGPDVTRRLYTGRRCVFFAFSEYQRHNWAVSSIWPEVRMVFLPLSLGLSVGGRTLGVPPVIWYKERSARLLLWFARLAMKSGSQAFHLHEVYRQAFDRYKGEIVRPIGEPVREEMWLVAYARLLREVKVDRVRLQPKVVQEIRDTLGHTQPYSGKEDHQRLCCLYLRQKGAAGGDPGSFNRNGSSIEDYKRGISLLVDAGYKVLLTGDVLIEAPMYHEFGGALVDANWAGVEQQAFSIFAATECDIFIGEAGGGNWLPAVNGIPELILNGFPYFFGLPNSSIYYKTVTNSTGDLVPLEELFSKYAYDYELTGMNICTMDERAIFNSIKYFLEDVTSPEFHEQKTVGVDIPSHTMIRHAKTKLSPAFLEEYERRIPSRMQNS